MYRYIIVYITYVGLELLFKKGEEIITWISTGECEFFGLTEINVYK